MEVAGMATAADAVGVLLVGILTYCTGEASALAITNRAITMHTPKVIAITRITAVSLSVISSHATQQCDAAEQHPPTPHAASLVHPQAVETWFCSPPVNSILACAPVQL